MAMSGANFRRGMHEGRLPIRGISGRVLRIETVRIGIERGIAIGRGDQNNNHFALPNRLPGDNAIPCHETDRAVGAGVAAQHFLNDIAEQRAVLLDLPA